MAQRVTLAVAGAGKTYYICHSIDPKKRNLILAFTHENVFIIQRELSDAFGCIPKLTTVVTFDAFVYHNFILPYEPSIAQHFGCPQFVSQGITTESPPRQGIEAKGGRFVPNRNYHAKNHLLHYVNTRGQYYCSTLSELALQVKNRKASLVKRAANRLGNFYDSILIDEFQDFRVHDYDLILKISKTMPNITLVGDFFQHSVSGINNTGRPYLNGKKAVSYEEFIGIVSKEGFEIDERMLCNSRRCSKEVCDFVRNKTKIGITSAGINEGTVIWVHEEIEQILSDNQIMKLVYKDSGKYTFPSMNWSYSKGSTVDSACVILTDKFEDLDDENFSLNGIAQSTINRLYVALTRSRGDVYLIKASQFHVVKESYLAIPN